MTTAIELSADEIERVEAAIVKAVSDNIAKGKGFYLNEVARAAILAMDRRAEVVGATVEDVEKIILAAEPYGDEDATWTRRMAVALHARLFASPPAPAVAVPELLGKALAALDNYADPTGYTDGNGEQLDANAEVHEGLLAKSVAAEIRAALAAAPEPPATRSEADIRNEGREEAARIVEGQPYGEGADDPARYRTWAHWPTLPNGTKGNRSVDDFLVKHCDALATAIRALKEPRHEP